MYYLQEGVIECGYVFEEKENESGGRGRGKSAITKHIPSWFLSKPIVVAYHPVTDKSLENISISST